MDSEELEGVKFSEFPSATPGNSDEVVGLHSGDNARFSIANIVAAVRNGLASIFVPLTRTINGKGLSTNISLDSSDIDYDNTQSGLTATDVQDAIDELAQGGGGGSAADITYDPTTSGASATNVQDALDEAFGDLDDKQDEITASGILKGDGAGGVTTATPGTDYQAPLTAGTDYATPAQLADKANQSQLAYVETGTTASRNYAMEEWIAWQGRLYKTDKGVPPGATFYASGGNKNLTEAESGGFNAVNSRQALINGNVIFEVSGRTAIFRSNDNVASSTDIRNTIIPQYYRPKGNVSIPIAYYNGSSWVNEGRFLRVYSVAGNVIISNLLGGIDSTITFTHSVFCATWTF